MLLIAWKVGNKAINIQVLTQCGIQEFGLQDQIMMQFNKWTYLVYGA